MAITAALVIGGMSGGYACRRMKLLGERTASTLMMTVAVFGYPLVSLLGIWATKLSGVDFWLPLQAVIHMVIMAFLGLVIARLMGLSKPRRGLFSIASALGNTGVTLGAFVCYFLFGDAGLGLSNIYGLLFGPLVVLLIYPIARRHSTSGPGDPLGRMLVRNLLDWRSIALPVSLAGIGLSLAGVPRPQFVADFHIMDGLVWTINAAVYFAIGLRLHGEFIWPMRWTLLALAFLRFILAGAVGIGLLAITWLTPWAVPWRISGEVMVIQSFVSMAVTTVAVASMFHLKPRQASTMFVVNTVMYLVIVLPIVLYAFHSR